MKRRNQVNNRMILALSLSLTGEALAEDKPAEKEPVPAKPETASQVDREALTKAADASKRSREVGKDDGGMVSKRLKNLSTIWTRVAEAQKKAAELEAAATKLERETLVLESQARRATSLLEQTEARRARALARLRQHGLEPETKPQAESPAATKAEVGAPAATKAGEAPKVGAGAQAGEGAK